MKKWGLLNPLNWALDEDALSKAIANFGKVDMEGVLMLPNEEPSKCLPARYIALYNPAFCIGLYVFDLECFASSELKNTTKRTNRF